MNKAAVSRNKPLLIALVSLLCAVLLCVCVFFVLKQIRENSARYTPDQITQKILAETGQKSLVKVESAQISKHYDLPEGMVVSCSVNMSKSSESAEELSCFLLSSSSEYAKFQKVIGSHIGEKASGFKTLNPTQYDLLKNYKVYQSGRYVLVCVGGDSSQTEKIFRSLLA